MELHEYDNNDKITELSLPFSTQNIDKMDFTKANEIINNTLFKQFNPYNLNNLTTLDPNNKLYDINNIPNNVVAGVIPSDQIQSPNQVSTQPPQQTSNIQFVIEDNLIDEIMKEESARIQNLDLLPVY